MNGWLKAGTAVLLTMAWAFPAGTLAETAITRQKTDHSIVFSHTRHGGIDCATCHTAIPSTAPPSFPVPVISSLCCQACHDLADGEEAPAEGCLNCHNDVSPQ